MFVKSLTEADLSKMLNFPEKCCDINSDSDEEGNLNMIDISLYKHLDKQKERQNQSRL